MYSSVSGEERGERCAAAKWVGGGGLGSEEGGVGKAKRMCVSGAVAEGKMKED